jgi:hypothetical protein
MLIFIFNKDLLCGFFERFFQFVANHIEKEDIYRIPCKFDYNEFSVILQVNHQIYVNFLT